MPLEQQVLSLELAQKLKELGVKQDSLFYWVKGDKQRGVCPDCRKAGGLLPECAYCGGTGKDIEKQNYYLYGQLEVWQEDRIKDCSAFTVAELYSLLYSNGICDILITVKPEELADYLAEMLCKKLSK
jgi:hypothetical protein